MTLGEGGGTYDDGGGGTYDDGDGERGGLISLPTGGDDGGLTGGVYNV